LLQGKILVERRNGGIAIHTLGICGFARVSAFSSSPSVFSSGFTGRCTFAAPGASPDNFRLVLPPSLPVAGRLGGRRRAFAAATGIVAFGPRSGSKTAHFSIPDELPPGPLQRQLRSRVVEVSSLRPGVTIAVRGAISGHAERWREEVEACAETLATFTDGSPALVVNDAETWCGTPATTKLSVPIANMPAARTSRL
jgi:hypothetical protein